jgi:ferredoxin
VLPSSGGFEGDLILLLALLELPSMCIIAAGFSSRSIFGEIGSAREAVLSVSYNVVFLLAIVSIAASQHTFRLEALAQLPASPLRWLGVLAILVCLPAKLHLNPFSLPNAEQEIYSGPMTEYAGPELAMWELSHGLEWVAATGPGGHAGRSAPSRSGGSPRWSSSRSLSHRAAACRWSRRPRRAWQIDTTVRFYWQCTLIFAVLAVSSALFMRFCHEHSHHAVEEPVGRLADHALSRAPQGEQGLPGPGALRSRALHRLRICKFRCTARAIEFKSGKGEFTWSYDPGQCTFCGRCVEGCKEPMR